MEVEWILEDGKEVALVSLMTRKMRSTVDFRLEKYAGTYLIGELAKESGLIEIGVLREIVAVAQRLISDWNNHEFKESSNQGLLGGFADV